MHELLFYLRIPKEIKSMFFPKDSAFFLKSSGIRNPIRHFFNRWRFDVEF